MTSMAPVADLAWEQLFRDIWVGRNVAISLDAGLDEPGTWVVYDSWVNIQTIADRPERYHTSAIHPSIEPGAYLPAGIHTNKWVIRTGAQTVTGEMTIVVGDVAAPPGKGTSPKCNNGPVPQWANQVPLVLTLPVLSVATAVRTGRRLIRRADTASNQALEWGSGMVRRVVRLNMQRLGQMGAALDRDDAYQIGLARMHKDLVQFASEARPDCSWAWAALQNMNRDVQRAMNKSQGESPNVAAVRAWLWERPDVNSIQTAREAGLPGKYTDAIVHLALSHRAGSISLDTWMGNSNGQSETPLDRSGHLGVTDPGTSTDPMIGQTLLGLIKSAGIDPKEAEPWLYKIGALDYPHTPGEVRSRYGTTSVQLKRIEARFFSRFAQTGENWNDLTDRANIRARACQALVTDDSLVTT